VKGKGHHRPTAAPEYGRGAVTCRRTTPPRASSRGRFFTVPGDPALGLRERDARERRGRPGTARWWKLGRPAARCGTRWPTDAELDLLFIGTGNGSPWNQAAAQPRRRPDKLVSCRRSWRSGPDDGLVRLALPDPRPARAGTTRPRKPIVGRPISRSTAAPRRVGDGGAEERLSSTCSTRPMASCSRPNKFAAVNWASGVDPRNRPPDREPRPRATTRTGKPVALQPSSGGAPQLAPDGVQPADGPRVLLGERQRARVRGPDRKLQAETRASRTSASISPQTPRPAAELAALPPRLAHSGRGIPWRGARSGASTDRPGECSRRRAGLVFGGKGNVARGVRRLTNGRQLWDVCGRAHRHRRGARSASRWTACKQVAVVAGGARRATTTRRTTRGLLVFPPRRERAAAGRRRRSRPAPLSPPPGPRPPRDVVAARAKRSMTRNCVLCHDRRGQRRWVVSAAGCSRISRTRRRSRAARRSRASCSMARERRTAMASYSTVLDADGADAIRARSSSTRANAVAASRRRLNRYAPKAQ